jgi:hypothetical protein
VDVKGTLEKYLVDGGKGIKITPQISDAFGAAIGDAISSVLQGSMQVNGATFALSGDTATAKIVGTGSAAPLLDVWDVSATFTAKQDAVSLVFMAGFQSSWPVSRAWSVLNTYPFTVLTLSSGNANLTVDPGEKSFELDVNATASLDGTPVGTGLLVVSYESSTLGFCGGFIVTGTWTPASKWPVIGSLSIQGTAGVFASTITVKDLSAFDSLKLPYLPDEIDPGLTFLADIKLGGTLGPIQEFLPSGTNLSLLANLPPGGLADGATVTAALTEPETNAAFNFREFSLTWKSMSATEGDIDLKIVAVFNASSTDILNLTGVGAFHYGSQPTLSVGLLLTGSGDWTHPFGIPNLTILSVSVGFSLSDEGIAIGLGGDIQIGTGPNAVHLVVAAAILDFEAPIFVKAELAPIDKDKSVTLAQLIENFIPDLHLGNFPLLSDISFRELMFMAVAAPVRIGDKDYLPGIGAAGDITFFGYDLDFAFSLTTKPSVAVQAKGSISEGGGPIVISAGGVTILKLSDASGTKGPSACIDTKGAGFCGSEGDNAYFTINAAIELLGLANASIVAEASKDSFEFDVALGLASIFSQQLHCEFIPGKGDFAASLSTQFLPDSVTLGPWGPIPQFTIPTPHISLCVAVGTIVPSAPVCGGYMPGSAPYFHLDATFGWGALNIHVPIDLEMGAIINAFKNFEQFVKDLILNSAKIALNFLLQTAELLAKALYQVGMVIADIAKAVAKQFQMAAEEAWKLVTSVVDGLLKVCGVESGNNGLHFGTTVAMVRRQPRVLADLTASSKGQVLLYHYYLHRDELEPRLKSLQPGTLSAAAAGTADAASGRYMPLVIDVLNVAAAEGSVDLQASMAEVLPMLEQYRGMSYAEFLTALNE